MDITGLLIFLVIGGIAGWLAGTIMQGGGSGLLGNVIIGIVGGILGGFLFRMLAIVSFGIVSSIVTATVGAVVLLFLVGLVKKPKVA